MGGYWSQRDTNESEESKNRRKDKNNIART